jgi:hypothetical protein
VHGTRTLLRLDIDGVPGSPPYPGSPRHDSAGSVGDVEGGRPHRHRHAVRRQRSRRSFHGGESLVIRASSTGQQLASVPLHRVDRAAEAGAVLQATRRRPSVTA